MPGARQLLDGCRDCPLSTCSMLTAASISRRRSTRYAMVEAGPAPAAAVTTARNASTLLASPGVGVSVGMVAGCARGVSMAFAAFSRG